MSDKVTAEAALKSLRGFDVIAIGKQLGTHWTEADPVVQLAAARWVLANRDGGKLSWDEAMAAPLSEIEDFFADDVAEEELTGVAGKGDGRKPIPGTSADGAYLPAGLPSNTWD